MTRERIYLASASPRRRELLDLLGVSYLVKPADVPEEIASGETPQDGVSRLALSKAMAIHSMLAASEGLPILAADTLVVIDNKVLGKPRDAAHSAEILTQLSGRTHEVYTAVAMVDDQWQALKISRTEVSFRTLSAEEIAAYWSTGEPQDKAGSYAIQGLAAIFVSELKGSYSGVMGLPLYETAGLLDQAGVPYGMKTGMDDE